MSDTNQKAECLMELRETSLEGDSGAPIVSEEGLLVGVLIQQKDIYHTARFMPVKCFSSWITRALEQEIPKNVISYIANKPFGILKKMLKPINKGRPEWITNLRFAAAIDWAADHKDSAKRIDSRNKCPVRQAIVGRGIGMDRYERYRNQVASVGQIKEDGDELNKSAAFYEKSGDKELAKYFYEAGIQSYQKIIEIFRKNSKLWDESTSINRLLLAQSYKGIADVQTRLTNLTENYQLLIEAKKNAAYAAKISPSKELRGAALAALGNVALRTGEPQIAIEAFSGAVQCGYKKPWVLENYNYAFKKRDNVRFETRASDYKPAEAYKAINNENLNKIIESSIPIKTNMPSGIDSIKDSSIKTKSEGDIGFPREIKHPNERVPTKVMGPTLDKEKPVNERPGSGGASPWGDESSTEFELFEEN
jgi:hypothetical protein